MKTKDHERIVALYPEKLAYPWQILEAAGETWVIVRWKKKIALNPLRERVDVSLKNLSGDIVYKNEEKCFYDGKVSFLLSYQEIEPTLDKLEYHELGKELSHDEYLFSAGLFTAREEVISACFEEKNTAQETKFFTALLDGSELKKTQESQDTNTLPLPLELQDSLPSESQGSSSPLGNKTREIVLTWRCWLKGRGKNEPPVLKKVHIAQVGLSTLLLEAVIKLESKAENLLLEDTGLTKIVAEEKFFINSEDSIYEILGMPVEMAFWRYAYDLRRASLLIRVLKKTNLIYISSASGAERFLFAADRGAEELLSINKCAKSLYPVSIDLWRIQVKTGLSGLNKIVYQGKSLYRILEEPPQKKLEEIAAIKAPPIAVAQPPIRSKPGEKWRKKQENSTKYSNKKVITIKF